MSVCPLIQKIDRGNLYTFSSAISQENLQDNNTEYNFEFSKFVCIDLPVVKNPVNKKNNIQFRTIDGQIFADTSGYNSINTIQSFQNYVLNLESLILETNYKQNLKTTSERIFFKWLKELGALRFRPASSIESNVTRFVEEDEKNTGDVNYSKVIKYIGDIDVNNNVQYNGSNYKEVYINIPSEAGATPVVLFDTISDENYYPDRTITGEQRLNGRTISTIHPEGLSMIPFYDYYTTVNYTDSINADVFNQSISNNVYSYFTERLTFSDSTNTNITKNHNDYSVPLFSDVSYTRSKLDGISIDFDSSSYFEITNTSGVSNIAQYNSFTKSTDFEFNAILIYYDFYKTSDQNNKSTNLYGILFIEDMVEEVEQSYFPTFKKYKYNSFTNKNGTSYGLKLNLTSTQSILNSGVETIINDYSTFSMSIFVDMLTKLQNTLINFEEQNKQILDLSSRLNYIETGMFSITDITTLKASIDNLQNQFNNAGIALKDSKTILNMLADVNNRVSNIMNNNTSISMQYDLSVLQPGDGISVDKTVQNKLYIHNNQYGYNISSVASSISNFITIDNVYNPEIEGNTLTIFLKDYDNYTKIYNYPDITLKTNLSLIISDKTSVFKTGQNIKICFDKKINFAGFNLFIYSDYYNKFKYGSNNRLILNIPASELSNKPYIELICLDKDNYTFTYDILR